MGKSVETQLSGIEDGITKLIKTQITTFKLLALNQVLFYRAWAVTQEVDSLGDRVRHSYALTFGLLAGFSIAIAFFSLAYATNRPGAIVAGEVMTGICLAFGIYILRQVYGLKSPMQEAKDGLEACKKASEEYEREFTELSKYVDALEEEFGKPYSSSKDDIF